MLYWLYNRLALMLRTKIKSIAHYVPKQIVTEVSIKEIKKPKKKLGFFKRLKAKRLARKAKKC